MVHINTSLRQPAPPTYTQRNPVRHSTLPVSNDKPKPATTPPASSDPAADFRALFATKPAAATDPPPPSPPSPPPPPTAESVFGPNPWIANPGGMAYNGASYSYNPVYFATPATAAKVAQMLGGTVVERNAITPYGPFTQNQPNEMVKMPNGKLVNAGLVASLYTHGYSQEYLNVLIANEVNDSTA